MKYIIISLLLLSGCIQEVKEEPKIELDASLNITKTEVGFNIYSNTGELILEYTKQNYDSVSLVTLNVIYQTAKKSYNRETLKEAGKHTINLDASDISSGMYIYKLQSIRFVQNKKNNFT